MKKILSLSIILIIISIVSSVYANSPCEIKLQTEKDEFNINDEFVVNVDLSNIQDEKGIFGISAVLDYSRESLEYISMESQNGWEKPSYYDESGTIILLREEEYTKEDQTFLKIRFKVKEGSKQNPEITLKDIVVSTGEDITIENVSKIITTREEIPITPVQNPSKDNQSEENNTSNLSIPGDNAEQKLPKTGVSNVTLIVCIGLVVLIAIGLLIKVKVIDKDI
jgi:LPXTG-motif cell wall-anchored protein